MLPVMSKQSRSAFRLNRRAAGVLLQPTSLPGPYPIGDIGPAAERFIDQLRDAGVRWWQTLPLCPPGHGDCPYNSPSGMAVSELLVSPDRLVAEGWLSVRALRTLTRAAGRPAESRVNYPAAGKLKRALIDRAFESYLRQGNSAAPAFNTFIEQASPWLDAHATFMASRERFKKPWWRWPKSFRRGLASTLLATADDVAFHQACQRHRFAQWLLFNQLQAWRRYAHSRGIGLIGDVPLYVAHDSADVWANPSLFAVDKHGRCKHITGAPPDSFSATGQVWGHPLYRWKQHETTGFSWWRLRLERALAHADVVRLDHFVGLSRYWAIPADAADGTHGRWRKAQGPALLRAVQKRWPDMPFIVEDMAAKSPAEHALRDDFGLPRMAVLVDGFGDEQGRSGEQHRPHRQALNAVLFTTTHDTSTARGWLSEQSPDDRRRVTNVLGCTSTSFADTLCRLALSSPANTVIIPMQDLLGLGKTSRMNTPGQPTGQWRWRMKPDAWSRQSIEALKQRIVYSER